MGLFAKKVSCIGLDVGEHTIKVAKIQKTGAGYEITGFGVAPVPQGPEEGVRTGKEHIAGILSRLIQEINAKSAKVAMAVCGDNIIVRILTVPVMPDNELAEAVRYEAQAQLPIPAQDVTIDFVKSDIINDAEGKKQEVMVVAVRNDIIQKLVGVAGAVGLEPAVIDIEPLAMFRAMKRLNPDILPGEGSYAIVDLGASCTNISVFEKNRLLFTRTSAVGGKKLNMCLVNHYDMSMEDAEATKKMIDLNGGSEVQGLTVLLYQKTELLLPLISELVTEIGRSLEYYLAQHREQKISRIFLTGGGSQLKGLASFVEEELGIPVTVFNPTEYLQLSDKIRHREQEFRDAGAALTQAIGLALSEVD